MRLEEVKSFYKVKSNVELAAKLGFEPATMTYWDKDGIPYRQQCVLYYESRHKLKPNPEDKNK